MAAPRTSSSNKIFGLGGARTHNQRLKRALISFCKPFDLSHLGLPGLLLLHLLLSALLIPIKTPVRRIITGETTFPPSSLEALSSCSMRTQVQINPSQYFRPSGVRDDLEVIYEIGTVTIILVPWPAAVWISSFASICAALSRILSRPTPSLCSRRALGIPDPLSLT